MARALLNVSLSILSLGASILLAEGLCRLLLPVGQQVQVVTTRPTPESKTPTDKKIVSERGGIDTLLDWSGSHGLRLNPNVRATIVDHRLSKSTVVIDTNSIGIRDREIAEKQPDEFRVLMLGDSIVLGDYVATEETLPAQLEKSLASASHGSKKIRVINAGIPGANAADKTNLYLEIRDKIKPDLVLQMMYLNDSQDSREYYARPLALPWAYSRLLVWLSERVSIIKDLLELENNTSEQDQKNWREIFRAGRDLKSGDYRTSREAYDYEIYNAFNDFGRAWNPKTWIKLQAILHTMKNLIAQEGSSFALALLPVHMQIKSNEEERYPQSEFSSVCDELGLSCFDPLTFLRKTWQQERHELLYDHCHYQPVGYTLLANALRDWLVNSHLVPR